MCLISNNVIIVGVRETTKRVDIFSSCNVECSLSVDRLVGSFDYRHSNGTHNRVPCPIWIPVFISFFSDDCVFQFWHCCFACVRARSLACVMLCVLWMCVWNVHVRDLDCVGRTIFSITHTHTQRDIEEFVCIKRIMYYAHIRNKWKCAPGKKSIAHRSKGSKQPTKKLVIQKQYARSKW